MLRVEWTFDRALQRDTNARQYIANLSRTKTEDLLSKWWSALPSKPDEETCVLVLDATAWVRNKRKQQANLVTRVLCDGPSGMILVPLADAVLAEPYASGARRRFFRENPCVSGRYLQHESGASDADWRSFFETASKGLKGPFRFVENSEVVTRAALRQRLPEFDPPTTKSVPITKRHNDVLFSSNDYLLTDPALPNTLGGIINSSVSAADAEAIGLWLWEARQELTNKAVIRVHYVPYSSSDLYSQRAGTARWVGILQTARWLYGTDGTGPYAPAELLARPDPARPEAPVVRLAEDLATALETCGITFGTSVPEIPALERLRREGPVADTERALQLLTQAFEASQDNAEYRAELVSVLSTCALIGVPIGARPIDNAWRISAERLVKRKVRGADLGRWLVSIDTLTSGLADEDTFKQLIHLISSVCDIPDAPTWGQALAFLSWVWQSRPEAELVSSTLPRAYRLVAEELETDPACEDAWNDAKSRAIAYVASRKWVSVESEQLYLDDLGDDRLRGLVDGILFATPGHFGETPQEQHRIATLLGVRFLSDRFQVTLQATGERTLPAHWPRALDAILELLQTYAREEQADDFVQRTPLVISHFLQLRKVLIDQGVETKNWTVHAARREEGICVTGDPDDFAADLCRVLLQWTGLATRKDLDEVAPTITQLIGWLDKPDKFKRRLQVLTPQQGDTAPVSTPPTQPAPEDTPAPKREPGPPIPSSEEPPANDEPAEPGTPTDDDGDEEPPLSGGYTPENREGRLRSVQRKIDQLNKEKAALLGVGPIPDEKPEPTEGDEHPGTFASDVQYREAVVEYETLAGRYAETKDAKQPGYDIDSFDRPLDDPERLLIRRIEVKGHGCPWEDDDIVALSDRQFIEAFNKNANGTPTGEDFDYWLYVVERLETGLHVLPIRNPSRRAAKFEFRAGTWRGQAQQSNEDKNEDSVRL